MNVYEIELENYVKPFIIKAETAGEAIKILERQQVKNNEFDNDVESLKLIAELDN